ncbi:MAG: homocitrate synthase [Dehalococcoidales bacterium]|nr:homocitrate synthase [Dehalococcoidales bacterium]
MGKIYLFDVTNRDGVQTAKLGLSKLEKTLINIYLNEMGVYQSEFGFPTTRHERLYLQANLELAKKGVLKPIRLSGWVRATVGDVEAAFRRVPELKHINVSMSTSNQMLRGKFGGKSTLKDIIKSLTDAVDAAKSAGAESIGVNAEDASRTDINSLIEFGLAGRAHGADRIRYCDTLGYDNPFTIYEAVKALAKGTGMPVELHCHGDLGMAVANSLAGAKGAIDGGQDAYINTTVNGIGERAGNADLVAVILAITKSKDFAGKYQLSHPVDLSKSYKIAKFASYAFKVPIPINQPGVGANAFAHASGIHADGVLKDKGTYELYDFTELGRGEPEQVETGREICTGQYSGISGFRHVMDQIIDGFAAEGHSNGDMSLSFRNDKEAGEILELVRYANVEAQKPLVEEELLFIAKYPGIAKKLLTLRPLDGDD